MFASLVSIVDKGLFLEGNIGELIVLVMSYF